MKQNKIQDFLKELAADIKWSQVFAMICLMVLSSLFIYTATWRGGTSLPDELKKQWMWYSIGVVLYILISLMDYHWLCRQSWFIYMAVLVMLIMVRIPGIGKAKYGARRWIEFHGFSVQPSEFAKISVMLALCYFLSRSVGLLNDWRRVVFVFAIALIPGVLIEKQPDLGTALVVVAIFLMLYFLSGASMKFIGWLAVVFLLITALVSYDTHKYLQFRDAIADESIPADSKFKSPLLHWDKYKFDRILVWVMPEKVDKLGEGWNSLQSKIAIGSGGLQGKGWTKGNVTRGGYLPRTVSLNDFIFAVFAEETGFVGGAILVSLYSILLWGGIRITLRARDHLGMLLAAGSTFLLFFHTFMNMGMAIGILPIVGVPLPLMSYGGSFVLVCMVSLGMLQSVWLHRKPY